MRWVNLAGVYPSLCDAIRGIRGGFSILAAISEARGVSASELGVLLGLGIVVRLVAGPVIGRIADMTGALRAALAICVACAAAVAISLLTTREFGLLLLIHVVQSAALAPTTTLADALALNAANRPVPNGFEYRQYAARRPPPSSPERWSSAKS